MKRTLFSSFFLASLLLAQDAETQDITTQNTTTTPPPQDKIESTTPETLEIKKSSKSGVLLGIEAGIGWGVGKSIGYYDEYTGNQLNSKGYILYDDKAAYNKMNLFVGYQKYFGEKEILGFDVKVKGGIGLLSNLLTNQKTYYEDGTMEGRDPEMDMIFLYTPFSAGIEANFLYDFFQKDNHTLGMSAGLGYDFVYGVNFYANKANTNEFTENFKNFLSNATLSLLSPKLGLHYYYKHHQFGLKLSFDKAFGKNILSVYEPNMGDVSNLENRFNFFITTNLSYAYRF